MPCVVTEPPDPGHTTALWVVGDWVLSCGLTRSLHVRWASLLGGTGGAKLLASGTDICRRAGVLCDDIVHRFAREELFMGQSTSQELYDAALRFNDTMAGLRWVGCPGLWTLLCAELSVHSEPIAFLSLLFGLGGRWTG